MCVLWEIGLEVSCFFSRRRRRRVCDGLDVGCLCRCCVIVKREYDEHTCTFTDKRKQITLTRQNSDGTNQETSPVRNTCKRRHTTMQHHAQKSTNKNIRRSDVRESEWFGEHLLHQTLCIKPFCLLLIRCPHGPVLLVMVGMDHMAAGMDVDVAAGVVSQRYAPMSNGSARSAILETGGVVRIADTV